MAKKKKRELTPQQDVFVREYLVDYNATQAAIRAGYSPETAGVQGYDLLKRPHIATAVLKARAERSKRVGISADRVLEELGLIAFADIGKITTIGEDGIPRLDFSNAPDGYSRLIKKITQQTWAERTGWDEEARKPTFEQVKEVTVEFYSKDSALKELVEHLGLKPPREVVLRAHVDAQLDKILDQLQAKLPGEDYERILAILEGEGEGQAEAEPEGEGETA